MEKNKELTPMQELIEWVKTNPNINISNKARIIEKAKQLLPKEKQVNEEFWEAGNENVTYDDMHGYDRVESFETYYNTKYNNQIK